jgi:hypothetical protein
MNAPCTKCSIENAYEGKQMHQYQNASYVNAYKCNNMQYHAAGEECIWMKCNENDENASECIDMHWNAYVKKQHHFRLKTTHFPDGVTWRDARPGVAKFRCHVTVPSCVPYGVT